MFASELHQLSGQTNESVAPAKSLDAAGTFDTEPRPPRPRLFYLDNLRILLTVLVVLFHAAITYGNIPIWYYTEPARDSSGVALDLLVMFNQTFFMGFFFLIAGYFVPGSYDRKGGRSFMKHRLVRLGIPLLAFLLVLRPILIAGLYPKLRAMAAKQGVDLPYWLFYLVTWDPGPLWFVEVLLLCSALYVLYRKYCGEDLETQRSDPALAGACAPGRGAILGFALTLAVLTYLWRFIVPLGQYWPLVGLPTPAYLPQYASLFTVGLLAYRRGWLQALSGAAGWFGLAMAVVASAVLLPFTMQADLNTARGERVDGLGRVLLHVAMQADLNRSLGHGTWQSMVQALWESLFAVGVIVALLVLFRERLNVQGWAGRFLYEQAYAVYVIHPLVLVGLGHAFAWLNAIAVVKFAIVAVLALPLCWMSAYLIRSLPAARRVL
jgi:glucans biosynthesis protein C